MSVFSRLRERRRARILERSPMDDELWNWVLAEHRILAPLDPGERALLRNLTTVFLAEKEFHPVRNLELGEDMKASIAAQACLPVLRLGLDWYRGWSSVIVTPEEFSITRRDVDTAGVVHEYDDELGGEVLSLGPVVFSWRDVEDSGWGDGYNVVIHEMAHKLDDLDGGLDGCPPLHRGMSRTAWRAAFGAAYDDLRESLDQGGGRRGRARKPKIDEYAAESPPEFFAVICEYFFERPLLVKAVYPAVYGELAEFFMQDPASRV